MERIIMNTESLQNNFPEVYRDFFARNDLVFSSFNIIPFTFFWYNFDDIKISKKVPTKTYIWIKFTNNNNIRFWLIKYFDLFLNNFVDWDLNNFIENSDNVLKYLENFLKENYKNIWFEINFISENQKWHWFWFSWVSSSLISYSINYLLNIDDNNIIYNFWLDIENIFRNWKTKWLNCFTSLIKNSWLTLNIEKQNHLLSDYYWLNNLNNLPFDYWVIFLWENSDFNNNITIYNWYKSNLNELNKFFQNDFNDLDLFNSTINFSKVLNLKLLKIIIDLHNNPYDEIIITKFIKSVRDFYRFMIIIENENKYIDLIYDNFSKFKVFPDEEIWIFPINSSKLWGWYIFISKHNRSRNTIKKTFEEIKKQWINNIFLEYCSYLDWFSSDWIILEQDISKDYFSKYIDKKMSSFSSNKWKKYLGNYWDIIEKEKKWLILDLINKKISFNWKKLTSKNIPSQNTTIDIIVKLLDNIWNEISNKDLPISTYTWNKNEMLWKIILPLVKYIDNETWEKLWLICKWSITDFYLKLIDSNIEIWVIKKII